MPKNIIDYSKCIIYKIVCNDLNITDIYVGHTTNFIKRKYKHKSMSKCGTIKLYETIRSNGGWENWSMIQIEEYPCKNINEAFARERYWFEELNAKLNIRSPIRKYDDKNDKEFLLEYKRISCKKWKEKNKEYVKEYQKKYYQKKKE
jgi:hypothetical protein